jgi:lipoprotein-anchoring transpeptidase ErfK/SrfK
MSEGPRIEIDLASQRLRLLEGGRVRARYDVSTAVRGAGEEHGSERTPRGLHVIRAKIGAGLPRGAVLVGRRPTGEIWSPELQATHPRRDWILTRILWLSGKERGRNRLGNVDSMRRFIYIHGSPETATMGRPGSHGCIRMRNDDILALFDAVPVGTEVHIAEARET